MLNNAILGKTPIYLILESNYCMYCTLYQEIFSSLDELSISYWISDIKNNEKYWFFYSAIIQPHLLKRKLLTFDFWFTPIYFTSGSTPSLETKEIISFFGVGRGSHFRKGEKHPPGNMALNLPSANTKFPRNCKTIGLSVSVLSCYKIYLFLSLSLSIFLSLSV